MSFDPDPPKQTQERIFSRKVQTTNHHPFPQTTLQKHLGMFLDSKLQKTNKTIRLLRNLQTLFPRAPLITIFKSFIRSHLDYVNMIYDQTFNMLFQQIMETIQYNASLAITGAIRGSSREKLYQKLDLETRQK